MIRGLLIDLDDTLADDRFSTEQAVLALWQAHAGEPTADVDGLKARWLAITDRHWRRFRAGETSLQAQRRARLCELFGRTFTDAQADRLFDDYLAHYEVSWRLVEGAREFLAATSALPKVIVTNAEALQATRKVRLLGIEGHFTAIVTPEVAGVPKPKPEIFRHALGLLGLPAADCLMIGDSHEYDIAPAQALGLATFHVGTEPGRGLKDAVPAA